MKQRIYTLGMAALLAASMGLVGCTTDSSEPTTITNTSISQVSTNANTINLSNYDGEVEIKEAGTYTITGTLADGQLKINVGEDDTVTLIFQNASIANSEDHAIKVKSGNLVIQSGTATLTASQDGINANQSITIEDCDLKISAGDDGIHADETLTINGGTIDVTESNEGLEGTQVIINDGDISVVATDDGINASDGTSDSDEESTTTSDSSMPGMMQNGQDPMANYSENCLIQINGGTVYVDATADGLDSNGNVEITGGVVLVSGPSSDGEGAFDYDGTATISGGTVLMIGSSGMYQDFSSGTQAWATITASGKAGDIVELVDSDGKVIASVTATKNFGTILASYASLSSGDEVTVTVNGTSQTSTATTTSQAGGMGGMMGGQMDSQNMPGMNENGGKQTMPGQNGSQGMQGAPGQTQQGAGIGSQTTTV